MNTQVDSRKEKFYLSQHNLKSKLFEFLFLPTSGDHLSKVGSYFVLGMIYLMGVFHWSWLINFGKLRVKYMDWEKFFDYYGVIKKALTENTLPYFMPYFYKGTNQFLAIPETDLTPTIFLLKYLSVEDFFLTQLLVMYSLGFLGSLWLKKRFQWSLFTFVFFFLIFNMNGHIVSHIAIGHWPWISYFLFPFLIVWILRLAEGEVSLLHGTRLAWVLFGMLLLGGLHPFVWCLIFLFVMCLFEKRYWKPVSVGVSLAMVFSSYRIIPAAVTYLGYKNAFTSGFPSISIFWKALTSLKGQENMLVWNFLGDDTAPWWEVDHYIGIIGLAVMICFGIVLRLKKKNQWGINDYRTLNGPMLILAILSLGNLYELFTLIPIPLISVERISARFLIVPLLILLVISCVWMQQMFQRLSVRWSVMFLALAGILIEGFMLFEHSTIWHVRIWEAVASLIKLHVHDPHSEWAKSVEGYYVLIVQISYLISLIALVAFAAGSLYFKRKRPASGNEA
jgi:hypothetical protein